MKTLQPSEGGVLLLGGRSEIGVALASRLCNGRPVVLAQRPSQHDVGAIEDLLRGGAQQVYCLEWDALVESDLTSIYERAEKACGMPVSTIIVAFESWEINIRQSMIRKRRIALRTRITPPK